MSDERRAAKDLVLAPNEYAFISDETKGNVDTYVGPHKTSLANTDQPVRFNSLSKTFEPIALEQAKFKHIIAPVGWYVVLKNPAEDGGHPQPGGRRDAGKLAQGKKVNHAGPVSFALFPGQMAKVLQGHHIHSNEYLLVRIYDEEAARDNWNKAVMKSNDANSNNGEVEPPAIATPPVITMGKLFVIKGTEVSFYIPPTGAEVVPDEKGNLVREAVTLERLDYCLLKSENGEKRYVQGPAVVFPEPTEVFAQKEVENSEGNKEMTRRFRAIELNEKSGIYVKVIADYEDGDKKFHVGQELFITGKDQMIYFPREEHAVIKYGEHEIHYGVLIPAGEARYVSDRNTGEITLMKGPTVFLADPRHQVITRRILDAKLVQHLYPGNQTAIEFNAKLLGVDTETYLGTASNTIAAAGAAAMAMNNTRQLEAFGAHALYSASDAMNISDSARHRRLAGPVAKGFAGDDFNRKGQYVAPRTLTLNTRYDGAVAFNIWTGYAVKLVRKTGASKVVIGPKTVLLEYDEEPQILGLSSGKPKTTDQLYKTAYLRVTANKVSDMVDVETRDFCKLRIKLSYRVNFEGDQEKWFDVENYVKFLCDHMRSRIANSVRRYGVEEFYGSAAAILRDIILGKSEEGKERPGTAFKENGMRIYDVEVLMVELENKEVQNLLVAAQRDVIGQALQLAGSRRKLDFTQQTEELSRQSAEAKAQTTERILALKGQELEHQLKYDMAEIEANAAKMHERLTKEMEEQSLENDIANKKLEARKVLAQFEFNQTELAQQQRISMIEAEVQAIVNKANAVSPGLIQALQGFSERAMVEKIAESMAPLSILTGGKKSVMELLGEMVRGTRLSELLLSAAAPLNGSSNGNGVKSSEIPRA